MPARPTLLVFTLGPARERARRRLLPAALAPWEEALHRRGLDEALAAGREAGCRLVVAAPPGTPLPGGVERLPQVGGGFGERLTAAIRDAAAAGPLVVVGTDTPGLTATHLRRALAALAADPDAVVVGPAPDGGLYLLAAARPLPDLAAVPWRRGDTRRRLAARCAAAGRPIVCLEALADLDRGADLARWLARPRRLAPAWSELARRLRAALRALCRPARPRRTTAPRLAAVTVRAGRAPPR